MSKQTKEMAVKLKNLCGQGEGNSKYERSLDLIFQPGCYQVEICHNGSDVGLPVNQCDEEHYVVGNLIVTESGTTGTRQYNRVVGQLLTYSNRKECKTVAFSRSYANGKWGEWKELLMSGFIDEIKTTDDLLLMINNVNADITTLKGDGQGSVQNAISTALKKNSVSFCADAKLNSYIKELYIGGENVAEQGFYVKRIIKTNEDTCVLAVFSADESVTLYFESSGKVPYGYFKVSSGGYTLEAVINFEKVTENWGDPACDATTGKLLESSFNIDLSPTIKAEHLRGEAEDLKVGVDMNSVIASHSIVNAPVIPFMTGLYIDFSTGKEIPIDSFSGATPYLSTFNIHSIYTTAVISATGAKIAFYDKDKNYLRDVSISGESAETTYEFSSQLKEIAKYFRVSFYAADINSANKRNILKIEWINDYYTERLRNSVGELSTDVLLNTLETKGVVFTDHFDLSTAHYGNNKLHFLPIPAGTKITFRFLKVPYKINLVVVYKSCSEGVIVAMEQKTGDSFVFTPERDIDYFGYWVFKDGNANAEVVTQVLTQRAVELETLVGKKELSLLIFGDSITETNDITFNTAENPYSVKVVDTYGSNWPKLVKESGLNNVHFRLGEVRNYAKSGASFRDRRLEDRQYLGFQIDEAFADLNAPEDGYYHKKPFNPDVVIVSIGTNDGTPASADTYDSAMCKSVMKDVVIDGVTRQQIDIQETLNNLDTKSTIGEAIRHSYMRLREKFPNALFVYATPIQRLAYETPPTQLELFKSLAKRYNFVIADCNSESGIVRDYQTWDGSSGDLKDGLHPTKNGSMKIAMCIVNTLISNVLCEV